MRNVNVSDDCTIKHIEITAEEMTVFVATMEKGNAILLDHARRLFGPNSKGKNLRVALHKTIVPADEASKLLGRTVAEMKSAELGLRLGISSTDLSAIYAVQKIEMRLIHGHMNMIRKIAKKAFRCGSRMTDMDDLIFEGVIACRNAIYNYQKSPATFFSYAYGIVSRRVFTQMTKDSGLGGMTERAYKLLRRFHKAQAAAGKHATIDEVMTHAGFTPKEIADVQTLSRNVVRDSELSSSDGENSYGIDNMSDDRHSNPQIDVREAMQRANLTVIERELLTAIMEGAKTGFQTEIASRHLNPRTNQPYTRARIGQMLEKAKSKVHSQLTKYQIPRQEMAEVA